LVGQLEAIAAEARAVFGGLDGRQLNWKPAAESWSVGQCFEHLLKTNAGFFSTLERIGRGEHRSSLWEKWSPLSGFFGRMVLRAVAPGSRRKFKAAAKTQPASSDVEADVIGRFAEQQARLAGLMRATDKIDLNKTVVTSPVASFVTYSLFDAYRVVVMHERRHFEQARRVTEAAGFPKAVNRQPSTVTSERTEPRAVNLEE
jgi:hypothetical protein